MLNSVSVHPSLATDQAPDTTTTTTTQSLANDQATDRAGIIDNEISSRSLLLFQTIKKGTLQAACKNDRCQQMTVYLVEVVAVLVVLLDQLLLLWCCSSRNYHYHYH